MPNNDKQKGNQMKDLPNQPPQYPQNSIIKEFFTLGVVAWIIYFGWDIFSKVSEQLCFLYNSSPKCPECLFSTLGIFHHLHVNYQDVYQEAMANMGEDFIILSIISPMALVLLMFYLPFSEDFLNKKFNFNFSTPEKLSLFVLFMFFSVALIRVSGLFEPNPYLGDVIANLIIIGICILLAPILVILCISGIIKCKREKVFIFLLLLSFITESVSNYFNFDFLCMWLNIVLSSIMLLVFIPFSPLRKLMERNKLQASAKDGLYLVLGMCFIVNAIYNFLTNGIGFEFVLYTVFAVCAFLKLANSLFKKTYGFKMPLSDKIKYLLIVLAILVSFYNSYENINTGKVNKTLINKIRWHYYETAILAEKYTFRTKDLFDENNKQALLENKHKTQNRISKAQQVYISTYVSIKNINLPSTFSDNIRTNFEKLKQDASSIYLNRAEALEKLQEYIASNDEKSYYQSLYLNKKADKDAKIMENEMNNLEKQQDKEYSQNVKKLEEDLFKSSK